MNIRELFHLNKTKGDVGVEIEVEGINLPRAPAGWRAEADGSLRGESAEYVLNAPVTMAKLDESLKILKESFLERAGSEFFEGYRAGVHIHLNVQELTPIQLATMVSGYYLFEELLLSQCKKDRQGNHFCLRARDAEGSFRLIKKVFETEEVDLILRDGDKVRYSAINYKCLGNYGSLEFRSLESTKDFNKIKQFAKLHYDLKVFTSQFKTPIEFIRCVQEAPIKQLCEDIFKENADAILKSDDFMHKYLSGMDLAEEIAHCRVWGMKSLDIFAKNSNIF